MEQKNLPEIIKHLLDQKESLPHFLPFFKKIPNFNLFQMSEKADSLFHVAVLYSRKDLIEFFIKQDYQISLLNKNLETPLHIACLKGETEIAKILIKRSKNLNLQDYEGNTPLHKAMECNDNNKKIIIHLVKNGCDINKINNKHETPLTYGLSKGLTQNIEYLLEFNVDFTIKNHQKLNALYLACERKETAIINRIVKNMKEIDYKSYSDLLAFAIKKKSLEIVEILINNGFSITKNDIKLAFEIGESRIWWLLKSKKNLKATTEKKDSLNSNPENIEMNQDFLFLRNENENLKKKIPEYEKILLLYEEQVRNYENEKNLLIKENEELRMQIESLKKEINKNKFAKIEPYFMEEYLAALPLDITTFFQEKGLGNELEGILINPSDLKYDKKIGVGGFASVYKGKIFGTPVAIKLINHTKLEAKVLDDFLKEVNLLKRIRHPNIILLMGAVIKENTLGIITEYMPNKSILDVIKNYPDLISFPKKVKIALQIAKAMNYLHSMTPPIFHRDLKTANCLCDKNFSIKICDLGMAKIKDSSNSHTNSIGTPEYMAPEFISNQAFFNKSDVFSFGMVLWEIFSVEKAFCETPPFTVIFEISNKKRPEIKKEKIGSEEVCQLIEDCWQDDKDLRPDFDEIMRKLKFLNKKIKSQKC